MGKSIAKKDTIQKGRSDLGNPNPSQPKLLGILIYLKTI
jgi:hypothetical protein